MSSLTFSSDHPAKSDSLGRTNFAKALARALMFASKKDGLVVGIEGDWGSGKSTIIGFIKDQLSTIYEDGSQPIIIDFNPWMISNTGALVESLVTQIAASISVDSRNQQKGIETGQKLLNYVGLLKHLKHLKYLKYVPGSGWLGNIAEDISEIGETSTQGIDSAQKALDDLRKTLPTLDISKRKDEVVDALNEFDKSIIVIVDDLDRLPADEIRLVVQAIKAVANFPRTTYLLAYDREIIANALGHGNSSNGYSYLEKIVQVAYPIPPLFQYQLGQFVKEKLEALIELLDLKLREYEKTVYAEALTLITRLVRQPRDVIRLMNRLILSIPAVHGEVNFSDVIVFEALSQRFPSLRDHVQRHPIDFVGQIFRGDLDDEIADVDWQNWSQAYKTTEDNSPSWEKHLPNESPDRTIASKACSFLFPQNSRKHGIVPEDHLRIVDPDRLARYFRMTSLENVPEANEIHCLLENPSKLAETLEGSNETDIKLLLEWIKNYVPSCEHINSKGSIDVIIDLADKVHKEANLSKEFADTVVSIFESILRHSESVSRILCFNEIILRSPLSISESILRLAAAEQGLWIVRPELVKAKESQLIDDKAVVSNAIQSWSRIVRDKIHSNELQKEVKMHGILYRFAQLNYAYNETYAAVWTICESEAGLKALLSVYTEDGLYNETSSFGLVENAQTLINKINSSTLKSEYKWLVDLLSTTAWTDAIAVQATNNKNLKPMAPNE